MAPQDEKMVLFDLDNTLFDHYHSLRCAISAVQEKYSGLAATPVPVLINHYSQCLQRAYDRYLDKVITHDETESEKVKLFFQAIHLPEPTAKDIKEFRDTYKPVYRENRRATPGSIETLARLREHGYRLAIITNGQIQDQADKAKAIGVDHLIDHIITSEEAGYPKPDVRIFQYAMGKLSYGSAYMVGDSIESDIRGALEAQLTAVLYSPLSHDTVQHLFGQDVSVIKHMSQLLSHLGISNPSFNPQFTTTDRDLVVHGFGIDTVTEPRHCLNASQDFVLQLSKNMGLALVYLSATRYIAAISLLVQMIQAIAEASAPIRVERLLISFPENEDKAPALSGPEPRLVRREHSICVEYENLGLKGTTNDQMIIREVTLLLQSHCNHLMKDYPRAAIRQLRTAIFTIARKAGVEDHVVIAEEEIDQ
ncbi:had-superfamily protein [Fusarium bulbicola]|nr:had-superfamily protein [Fusarium bulbicola]